MCEQLKPCPFCGGEAEVYPEDNIYFKVECTNEECYAYFSGSGYGTEEEAIAAWNRRAGNE